MKLGRKQVQADKQSKLKNWKTSSKYYWNTSKQKGKKGKTPGGKHNGAGSKINNAHKESNYRIKLEILLSRKLHGRQIMTRNQVAGVNEARTSPGHLEDWGMGHIYICHEEGSTSTWILASSVEEMWVRRTIWTMCSWEIWPLHWTTREQWKHSHTLGAVPGGAVEGVKCLAQGHFKSIFLNSRP